MNYCQICFDKHGPGCVASSTDDAGRGVCVFCEDGVLCPVMKRFLNKEQERRSVSSQEEQVNHSDVVVSTRVSDAQISAATPIATTAPPARLCCVPDCGTILIAQNKSGFCTRHFHRSKMKTRANGHGSTARTNGNRHAASKAPGKTNGHAIAVTEGQISAARTCKVPDCRASLRSQNNSGYCHAHFHLSRRKLRANGHGSTNGHGHAAAKLPGTNGHRIVASKVDEIRGNGHARSNGHATLIIAAPANSNSEDHISETRVNSVILAWPLDQKIKALHAWLSAAI